MIANGWDWLVTQARMMILHITLHIGRRELTVRLAQVAV